MAAMEPTLLDFIVWKQESWQAIMSREILSLLASYPLLNSTVQQDLIEFQQEIKRKGLNQVTDGW